MNSIPKDISEENIPEDVLTYMRNTMEQNKWDYMEFSKWSLYKDLEGGEHIAELPAPMYGEAKAIMG